MTDAALVSRIDALVTRLERLERGEAPELFAATDSSGNPGAVAAGQLIESAWGNATVDRVVRRYATAAARNAALTAPVAGAMTYVEGNNSVQLRDTSAQWIEPASAAQYTGLGTQTGISGPVTIPGSGYTPRSSTRRYLLIAQVAVFKGGVAGGITINPNPLPAGMIGVSRKFGTPESGTITGVWLIPGTAGGALTITPEAGSIDVLGGGYVALIDIGSTAAQYT